MTDPGNPDQGPKPGKSEPGKSAFGWYKPPTEPPRPLNEGGVTRPSANKTPENNQEILFRAAAIKCARMENELAELLDKIDLKGKTVSTTFIPGVHFMEFSPGKKTVTSYIEDIKGIEGSQLGGVPPIEFKEGIANDAKRLGIKTDRELSVHLHTDEQTREQFNEYSKKDPMLASNASTYYYFTLDGDYKKSSRIPIGIPVDPNRPSLYPRGRQGEVVVDVYESEMTAGDFEIAGQALQMLINRLKPQEEKSAE